MKTLHLTNAWHGTSGGIATFYRALISAANDRGQEIRLVVPGETKGVEECGRFGRIYRIRARRAPLNPQYRMIFPDTFMPSGSTLRQILASEQPQVVSINDKYTLGYCGAMLRTGLLKSAACRPVVLGLTSERMDDNVQAYITKLGAARSFSAFYMKWLYFPFFDHHIAVSHYTAEELRPASLGHPITRGVWVLPNGVDFEIFFPPRRSAEYRAKLLKNIGATLDSLLLLYVGRLVPEKNLELLLATMQSLKTSRSRDFRLLVAGDGVLRAAFEQRAGRLFPGKVDFLGHVRDRNQLASLLANCDAFLHPNPREPFGIGPLEAMASGLPVVVPDRGGVLSYATRHNAWIAPPEGESFAQAVCDAVVPGAARDAKVANALRTAEQFHWKHAAGLHLDLYEHLWRAGQGDPIRMQPEFYSTPAAAGRSRAVRTAAGAVQKVFSVSDRIQQWYRSGVGEKAGDGSCMPE